MLSKITFYHFRNNLSNNTRMASHYTLLFIKHLISFWIIIPKVDFISVKKAYFCTLFNFSKKTSSF